MLGGLDMPAGWVRIDMSVGLFFWYLFKLFFIHSEYDSDWICIG